MNLSDDELEARANRSLEQLRDVLVEFGADLEELVLAWAAFGFTTELLRSEMEAEMPPEERVLYEGLVAAGTPWLDAALEAETLAREEGS